MDSEEGGIVRLWLFDSVRVNWEEPAQETSTFPTMSLQHILHVFPSESYMNGTFTDVTVSGIPGYWNSYTKGYAGCHNLPLPK